MTDVPVSQEAREAAVTQDDIGWATSAAQHICSPQDRDAAIRLLAQAFARHRQQAERDVIARMERGEVVARYRHKKRGSIYEVIGEAELQMNFDCLVDGSEMVVYRGEDGKLWVREHSEFHDGRFEPLPTPPAGEA